ncbi:MAG: DUF5658 family protein [Candidatus Freyarchaeum deiterrae]
MKIGANLNTLIVFLSVVGVLNLIDLVETNFALSNGFVELNPIMAWMYGNNLMTVFKILMVTIQLLVTYKLFKMGSEKLSIGITVGSIAYYAFIVVSNFVHLIG